MPGKGCDKTAVQEFLELADLIGKSDTRTIAVLPGGVVLFGGRL